MKIMLISVHDHDDVDDKNYQDNDIKNLDEKDDIVQSLANCDEDDDDSDDDEEWLTAGILCKAWREPNKFSSNTNCQVMR